MMLKHVAKYTNVTISAVSKAINEARYVSDKIRVPRVKCAKARQTTS